MQAIPVQKPKLIGNQKGLTLIELLAVIIVLGIIMAIAVPSVAGVIERSKSPGGQGQLVRHQGSRPAVRAGHERRQRHDRHGARPGYPRLSERQAHPSVEQDHRFPHGQDYACGQHVFG